MSCGYGFTIYAVRSPRGLQLFGAGINTNSQIGFHEMQRNSGKLRRIISTFISGVN